MRAHQAEQARLLVRALVEEAARLAEDGVIAAHQLAAHRIVGGAHVAQPRDRAGGAPLDVGEVIEMQCHEPCDPRAGIRQRRRLAHLRVEQVEPAIEAGRREHVAALEIIGHAGVAEPDPVGDLAQ